jgi:hypothetical protein
MCGLDPRGFGFTVEIGVDSSGYEWIPEGEEHEVGWRCFCYGVLSGVDVGGWWLGIQWQAFFLYRPGHREMERYPMR